MPLGEIAAEVLGGVVRFIGGLIVDVVLEIAIRGPGYLICRLFKKNIDAESNWVVVTGIVFWLLVGVVAYFFYSYLSEQLLIDQCLDSGGQFNYQTNECVHG
jgi:hypothetical protein